MKKKNLPPAELDFTDVFFKEVSEDVQNDNLKAFWKKYGVQIVAFTAICLTVAVSFETIKHWQDKRNQQWSNAFAYAQVLQKQGQIEDSLAALNELAQKGNAVYADLARLDIINILFDQNKSDEALAKLREFIASARNEKLKHIALMKLASYMADSSSADELSELLKPIFTEQGKAWQPEANELIAIALLHEGKTQEAVEIYRHIINQHDINDILRVRAQNMISVLTSAGESE